jgi:hypothetical protein
MRVLRPQFVDIDWTNPITRNLALAFDGLRQQYPYATESRSSVLTRVHSNRWGVYDAGAFGSTVGNDTSSKILTTFTKDAEKRTIFQLAYRAGNGNSIAYTLTKCALGSADFGMISMYDSGSGQWIYRRDTVEPTQWAYAGGSPWTTGTWASHAATHDTTSASTPPDLYWNGEATGRTELIAPSGAWKATTHQFCIGGRPYDNLRYWDGHIGPTLIFDRILAPHEIRSLHNDPWQVFASVPRRVFILDAPATGVPTLSDATATAIGTTQATPRVTVTF